jgi:antitoxin MazE
MATKTRIIRIGNSQGVRIPKPLLEQSGLEGEVELDVQKGRIVIRHPLRPREGWEAAFATMAAEGDDVLLDAPTPTEWEETEWEW